MASLKTRDLIHRITIKNPGDPVSDGGGGFIQNLSGKELRAWASIETLGANEPYLMGRLEPRTTHVIKMFYTKFVSSRSVILWGSRKFYVTGVVNPEEKNVELWIYAEEKH